MKTEQPVHQLGQKANVLLSSVFGPYAQNDDYGSRKINPMELYHNQVTRTQGGFSLRLFVRSYGLKLIQTNIHNPCTLLDFPDLQRFIDEIKDNAYDIVGISGIAPNLGKVEKMCRLVRRYRPSATIVVGGHITNMVNIENAIDADYIVKGDGVAWFRRYLRQDVNTAIIHPKLLSCFGTRIMGIPVTNGPKTTAAILIPSVGCPVGCNFCSTSSFFGGKGHFVNFYKTGKELYDVMCDIEKSLKVHSFFVMDENFLLHRKRALELLEFMKKGNKSWALSIFSSARILETYSLEQLAGLGVAWVWVGLEGEKSQYGKLKGVDTKRLVSKLQASGIRVLGSSIIGMENHSPDNIQRVIDYAVSHNSVFHQFMLYTAVSGTPLYRQLSRENRLLPEEEMPAADIHGQYRFNFKHSHITGGAEEQYLINAFDQDFQDNGPSLGRLIRVLLNGWQTYQYHPEKRIRKRVKWEVKPLKTTYAGAVWAMKRWYIENDKTYMKLDRLMRDIYTTFGLVTRLLAPLIGRYSYAKLKQEEKRLKSGWTYEPTTHYETNEAKITQLKGQGENEDWKGKETSPAIKLNPALK